MGRNSRRQLTFARLPLLAAALVLAACGGSTNALADGSAAATTGAKDANGCTKVATPKFGKRKGTKPKKRLDPAKTYKVTLRTNCGNFTIKLAVKTSPATAASFVALARHGYFDSTVFHRIVPGFIIQGGDPTASGLGDPGYSTVDKPPASTQYTHGLVAMAKSPAQPAGTSGSQFFVVTAPDAQLPPDYAVLGTVVAGLQVVDRIGRLGDRSTEKPTQTVEIEKATVSVK
jgi:cyclophilin family peptidyl-prolyl cis-trans isomerase